MTCCTGPFAGEFWPNIALQFMKVISVRLRYGIADGNDIDIFWCVTLGANTLWIGSKYYWTYRRTTTIRNCLRENPPRRILFVRMLKDVEWCGFVNLEECTDNAKKVVYKRNVFDLEIRVGVDPQTSFFFGNTTDHAADPTEKRGDIFYRNDDIVCPSKASSLYCDLKLSGSEWKKKNRSTVHFAAVIKVEVPRWNWRWDAAEHAYFGQHGGVWKHKSEPDHPSVAR